MKFWKTGKTKVSGQLFSNYPLTKIFATAVILTADCQPCS